MVLSSYTNALLREKRCSEAQKSLAVSILHGLSVLFFIIVDTTGDAVHWV